MKTEQLQSYLDQFWDNEIIPTLTEYIKIPNKSPAFDPDWEKTGHMEKVLNLAIKWTEKHRPKESTLHIKRLRGRTPVIMVEIPENGKAISLCMDIWINSRRWKAGVRGLARGSP